MRLGRSGSGFLRAASNKPSASRRFFNCSKANWSARFEILHVNLVLTALFVDADGAAHGDLQAVFGAELDAAPLLLEENAANLRAIVFQSEVDVAGLRFAAIGNFALDADVGKVFGEKVADAGGELADGPDGAGGHEVERELLGHCS